MGTVYTYEWARYMLENGWSIHDRAELIETVCAMTVAGHNASFLHDVNMISSMTDAQYRALLSQATGMDAYMFPYTKALGEKWGERGILCWDLFRMSNLVQWGYVAGYLTYPEAWRCWSPRPRPSMTIFPAGKRPARTIWTATTGGPGRTWGSQGPLDRDPRTVSDIHHGKERGIV